MVLLQVAGCTGSKLYTIHGPALYQYVAQYSVRYTFPSPASQFFKPLANILIYLSLN